MRKNEMLGPWVRRFLLDHLIGERNLSLNTQLSYRDALAMLLPFVAKQQRKSIDLLEVHDLSARVVQAFLLHLEQERKVSLRTRNLRLAAIHSLAHFIAQHSPEHVAWCGAIRNVPFKRHVRALVSYLEKNEVEALLRVPDRSISGGARNYALLLFLYNTGARASEAVNLRSADLTLTSSPRHTDSVEFLGKGSKRRRCPLWPKIAEMLKALVHNRQPDERVFLNRRGQPMTRFGLHAVIKTCVTAASEKRTLASQETSRATFAAALHRDTSASGRRGHQHHPCVARTCLRGHYAHLRRTGYGGKDPSTHKMHAYQSSNANCSRP